jgi:hypothetical protein
MEDFFTTHIHAGHSLKQLTNMLRNQEWANDLNPQIVTSIEGEMPVTWVADHTIVLLNSGHAATAIYLRINEEISDKEIKQVFQGKCSIRRVLNATIAEIGFSKTF